MRDTGPQGSHQLGDGDGAGVLPLDLTARGYLAAMLPVVHLGFAVSEIGYFHALRGEPDSVALAYETFLLGHAAWFAGEDGRALLAALTT